MKNRRNLIVIAIAVLLVFIAFIIKSVIAPASKEPQGEEKTTVASSVDETSEYSTSHIQKETETPAVNPYDVVWGEIPEYSAKEVLLGYEDAVADGESKTVKWANDYAKAEMKYTYDSGFNAEINYSSKSGIVNGIKLRIGIENNWHIDQTSFREADINGDGSVELIIGYYEYFVYGSGKKKSIYVYDFKLGKELKVFDSANQFTAQQEQAILEVYKQWFSSGFYDLIELNGLSFVKLEYGAFNTFPVVYGEKSAVVVRFNNSRFTDISRQYTYNSAMQVLLVYKDGEFVVEKVWYDPAQLV